MPQPWYSIRERRVNAAAADHADAAEVFIYGAIGESWTQETVTARDFVRDVSALNVEQIVVRINSAGGSVPDGLAIYNALRRHKAQVTVAIDGMAMSIASLIAMAGDRVEIAENALLMIHAPWQFAGGNAVELREAADVLDQWAAAMAASYVAKTGKPEDEVMALLTDGVDHYYTAAEALEAGFVDAVVAAMPVAASASIARQALAFHPGAGPRLTHFIAAAPAASKPEPEIDSMTIKNAPQAEPKAEQAGSTEAALGEAKASGAPSPEAIATAALAAEKARRTDVRAEFDLMHKRFGAHAALAKLQRECEDDPAVTPEAAGQKILRLLATDAESVAGNHVVTVDDEGDKRREAVTVALLTRAGVADAKTREAARASAFRGAKLLDLARASLDAAGVRHQGMDQMQVVAAAFTGHTSDFPVLLENAMHKALQSAYATAADTWSRFCAVGSVSDFRPHKRYRVGSLGNLDTLNELGEFKNKAIPDGEAASISIGTRGNIINLSRQVIVNDDLGAFIGLADQLGRAARRTIEAKVYAVLAENGGLGPVMDDGLTLFHATHGNLTTGAALTVAAIEADRVAMASQMDVGGNDFLDLRPAALLVPMSLGGTARVINAAEYDPDTANKLQRPNMVRGLFSDIVDSPRLTGTRRYLFAAPAEAPVLEVAFLDGRQDPVIEQEAGFSVDGTRYKVRLDFGVGAIDYRGAVTNAGA